MDFQRWLKFSEMTSTGARLQSYGTLQYGPGMRAVVWVDQGISDFYRSLIPKAQYVIPQMYPAHITVVRTGRETPTNMEVWKKHEGERIPFYYDNEVHTDGTYYWLSCYSDRIGEIRSELGLPANLDRYKGYHITIGNVKPR